MLNTMVFQTKHDEQSIFKCCCLFAKFLHRLQEERLELLKVFDFQKLDQLIEVHWEISFSWKQFEAFINFY